MLDSNLYRRALTTALHTLPASSTGELAAPAEGTLLRNREWLRARGWLEEVEGAFNDSSVLPRHFMGEDRLPELLELLQERALRTSADLFKFDPLMSRVFTNLRNYIRLTVEQQDHQEPPECAIERNIPYLVHLIELAYRLGEAPDSEISARWKDALNYLILFNTPRLSLFTQRDLGDALYHLGVVYAEIPGREQIAARCLYTSGLIVTGQSEISQTCRADALATVLLAAGYRGLDVISPWLDVFHAGKYLVFDMLATMASPTGRAYQQHLAQMRAAVSEAISFAGSSGEMEVFSEELSRVIPFDTLLSIAPEPRSMSAGYTTVHSLYSFQSDSVLQELRIDDSGIAERDAMVRLSRADPLGIVKWFTSELDKIFDTPQEVENICSKIETLVDIVSTPNRLSAELRARDDWDMRSEHRPNFVIYSMVSTTLTQAIKGYLWTRLALKLKSNEVSMDFWRGCQTKLNELTYSFKSVIVPLVLDKLAPGGIFHFADLSDFGKWEVLTSIDAEKRRIDWSSLPLKSSKCNVLTQYRSIRPCDDEYCFAIEGVTFMQSKDSAIE